MGAARRGGPPQPTHSRRPRRPASNGTLRGERRRGRTNCNGAAIRLSRRGERRPRLAAAGEGPAAVVSARRRPPKAGPGPRHRGGGGRRPGDLWGSNQEIRARRRAMAMAALHTCRHLARRGCTNGETLSKRCGETESTVTMGRWPWSTNGRHGPRGAATVPSPNNAPVVEARRCSLRETAPSCSTGRMGWARVCWRPFTVTACASTWRALLVCSNPSPPRAKHHR